MITNYKKPTWTRTLCGCVVLLALGAVSMTTLAQKEEELLTLPVLAEIGNEPTTNEPRTMSERERLFQKYETALQRFITSTLELEEAFNAKNEDTTTVAAWLEVMRRNFESRHELFESMFEIIDSPENNDKTFLFKTLQVISDTLAFYDEQLRLLSEARNNAKTTQEETQIRSQYFLVRARQESNMKDFAIRQMLIMEKIANTMGVDTGIGFKPKPPELPVPLEKSPENNPADDAMIKIAELQLELAKAEAGRTIEIEYARAAWAVALAEVERKRLKNEQEPNAVSAEEILETQLRKVQAQKQYEKARYDLDVVRPIEVKIKEQELEIIKARLQQNSKR